MGLRSTQLRVSVCVVTFNQENYIRDCLQSIVDQETDFDFEIIICDDFSTDATRSIIQEFAEKYPLVVKPSYGDRNVGPYANYVATHNKAAAEFVSHCDGDDLFLPGKLQAQVDYFDANSGCAVTWHRVNLFDDQGNYFDGALADYSMFPHGIVNLADAIRFGSVATHSSIMYRRKARSTYHPTFDTLDLFYSWEYLCFGWGAIIDDVLGEYRVNSSGAISISSKSKMRALNLHHAKYYLGKCPNMRRSIFMFAFTNFLIDLKNKRKTCGAFLRLAAMSFVLISPREIITHLKEVNKLRVPPLSHKRN